MDLAICSLSELFFSVRSVSFSVLKLSFPQFFSACWESVEQLILAIDTGDVLVDIYFFPDHRKIFIHKAIAKCGPKPQKKVRRIREIERYEIAAQVVSSRFMTGCDCPWTESLYLMQAGHICQRGCKA